jgi:hypothetical protein
VNNKFAHSSIGQGMITSFYSCLRRNPVKEISYFDQFTTGRDPVLLGRAYGFKNNSFSLSS